MIIDLSFVLLIICVLLLGLLLAFQILFMIYGTEIKLLFAKLHFTKKRQKTEIKFLLDFFNNLASTLVKLANDKVGALIIIENNDSLAPYINIGNKIDTNFFPEFVTNIFYNHKSALHDGAMIIRN
jgi:diadenylate cyclase